MEDLKIVNADNLLYTSLDETEFIIEDILPIGLHIFYGAQKYDRVKKTLKIVMGLSVIISAVAFILFQTIPDKLILIFGSGDENYIEFACLAFKTYLLLCIFDGIQISSGIFFQAIGKSVRSAALSLSRQIVILIPFMIILSHFFGIMGVLAAGPVADALAFILAAFFLIKEIKNLKNGNVKDNLQKEVTLSNNDLGKNIVITISREYGSGGRYIGKLVAEKLGIQLYDKQFVEKLAEDTGLSEKYIEDNEQKRTFLEILNNGYYSGLNNSDDLFIKESELIGEVADKESCVIVGRCADFILKDKENVLKIFIDSSLQDKINRATEYYNLDKNKAQKEIKRINKLRENHYKYYTEREWKDPSNYDICINSDSLGIENAANLICELVNKKVVTN